MMIYVRGSSSSKYLKVGLGGALTMYVYNMYSI